MLILSEVGFLFFILLVGTQNSSLWSSIFTIPLSLAAVILILCINSFSKMIMIIYVMVFIGGLLVLLVSVAAVSFQDQIYGVKRMEIFLALLFIFPLFLSYKSDEGSINELLASVVWFSTQWNFISILVLFLLVSLFVMTLFLQNFKMMARGM